MESIEYYKIKNDNPNLNRKSKIFKKTFINKDQNEYYWECYNEGRWHRWTWADFLLGVAEAQVITEEEASLHLIYDT